MKVTITGVSPHPDGLQFGLTIAHEKAGWIRFATTVLVVDRLSRYERGSLLSALARTSEISRSDYDVPLFP